MQFYFSSDSTRIFSNQFNVFFLFFLIQENGLKGVEFASVVNNNVNATTAVTSILTNDVNAASHGKNTSLNHVDSNPPKEKSAYREVTVNKPQEKPVNTPHPTKPSGKNRVRIIALVFLKKYIFSII